MWSKSNADKLKMELSGKREKQLQSTKSEKVAEDNCDIKMDSGFLSGANLSCDMSSKENIEDDIKHEELLNDKQQKETTKTTMDSGVDICVTDDLSELNIDQKKPCDKNMWQFYFQQNDDGDTYVPKYFIFIYLPNLYLKPFDIIKFEPKYIFIISQPIIIISSVILPIDYILLSSVDSRLVIQIPESCNRYLFS